MALQKTPVSINFSQGVQTKTDPFQVPVGQFNSLTNTIFTKDGLQTKRNGYADLVTAPTNTQTLATLNGGLVLLGNTCQSFSEENNTTINAGLFQPMTLNAIPTVRRWTGQRTVDVGVSPSGIACSVSFDTDNNSYYQVTDTITGQILAPSVSLPNTAVMPRVFVMASYFIVTFLANTSHLQYIIIPIVNPTNPTAAVDISAVASSLSAAYDGMVINNTLFIALNCSDGGGAIGVWRLTQGDLVLATIPTRTAIVASGTRMSLTVDTSNGPGFLIIWVSYYHGTTVSAFALNNDLTTNLAPTTVVDSLSNTVQNLTSTATGNVLTSVQEYLSSYGYTPQSPQAADTKTDYILWYTMTLAGAAVSNGRAGSGLGLASKAVISSALNKTVFISCYGQSFQPTYYLQDLSMNILARFAYSNGAGYPINQILPSINQTAAGILQVGYLFADLLQPINKTQGSSQLGVYNQFGINLATFQLSGQSAALEIAGSLHTTGGMLWQYDGSKIVEEGFNVYPEDIGITARLASDGSMSSSQGTVFYSACYEWTDAQGFVQRSAPSVPVSFTILVPPANFTGLRTSGTNTLGTVSSFTNLQVGQGISGTGIPAGTVITALNPGTGVLTMSQNATSGSATSTTVTPTAVSGLYISVPYLRQTYKVANNWARIVIYRWTTSQQTYYRVTSITSPLVNTAGPNYGVGGANNYIQFLDQQSDAQIVGNDILYTNGGVVENIAAPGSNAMTLWQSRLFMVDAEDQNLIWFSKQVIEATPVEMSDLLTLYVAPTTGAQGSTGPITALSSMDDKLIIFKNNAIYYITGQGPDNTGANNSFSDPVFITSTVGCANPQSIVLTPNGIMFESDKGIWLLGRNLETSYIGAPVETYTLGNTVTSSLCIPATNQVRFTMNNKTAVLYDYYFNRWSNWNNITAVSSVILDNVQAYLNIYGKVVKETPNAFLDQSNPVLLGLQTGWINIAGLQGYERFYFGYLLGIYLSPFKLSVSLAYDYNSSASQSILISPDNYEPNWGGLANWGSGQAWGGPGNVFKARFFPMIQKCESFQVTIQEIYDPSLGVVAGAGLTLSGLNLVCGMKKGYRPQKASRSFG